MNPETIGMRLAKSDASNLAWPVGLVSAAIMFLVASIFLLFVNGVEVGRELFLIQVILTLPAGVAGFGITYAMVYLQNVPRDINTLVKDYMDDFAYVEGGDADYRPPAAYDETVQTDPERTPQPEPERTHSHQPRPIARPDDSVEIDSDSRPVQVIDSETEFRKRVTEAGGDAIYLGWRGHKKIAPAWMADYLYTIFHARMVGDIERLSQNALNNVGISRYAGPDGSDGSYASLIISQLEKMEIIVGVGNSQYEFTEWGDKVFPPPPSPGHNRRNRVVARGAQPQPQPQQPNTTEHNPDTTGFGLT